MVPLTVGLFPKVIKLRKDVKVLGNCPSAANQPGKVAPNVGTIRGVEQNLTTVSILGAALNTSATYASSVRHIS